MIVWYTNNSNGVTDNNKVGGSKLRIVVDELPDKCDDCLFCSNGEECILGCNLFYIDEWRRRIWVDKPDNCPLVCLSEFYEVTE